MFCMCCPIRITDEGSVPDAHMVHIVNKIRPIKMVYTSSKFLYIRSLCSCRMWNVLAGSTNRVTHTQRNALQQLINWLLYSLVYIFVCIIGHLQECLLIISHSPGNMPTSQPPSLSHSSAKMAFSRKFISKMEKFRDESSHMSKSGSWVTVIMTETDAQTDTGQSYPHVPLCFAGDTKSMASRSLW